MQLWHSPAKEDTAIVKVAKSKHEHKIACNEAKCIAFICHMAICFHAIWESVLVESKHARHDRKTYHIANAARKKKNIMSHVQKSGEMNCFLLNDWELWLFVLCGNKSTQYALPKSYAHSTCTLCHCLRYIKIARVLLLGLL